MASNTELSEIKQLLYSLASELKDVKSDLAELKKSQTQTPKGTSTCSSCAARSSKPSNVEKVLSNTETKLVAKVHDTQSAVLQLVEEEKVLILAEVVQLSRSVGKALEDAKGKMMEKVAGFTDGDEHGRKRRRSSADLDGDGDLNVAEKRVKQDEESDTDEYDESDDEDRFAYRRRHGTTVDRAVLDIMDKTYEALDCERVGHGWVLQALIKFHESANDGRIHRWDVFQKEGKIGFEYCLYGLFYHGHEHEGVARGECSCRERHPPGLRQRATRCIWVKRKEDGPGTLLFSWGADIGPAPVLGRYE